MRLLTKAVVVIGALAFGVCVALLVGRLALTLVEAQGAEGFTEAGRRAVLIAFGGVGLLLGAALAAVASDWDGRDVAAGPAKLLVTATFGVGGLLAGYFLYDLLVGLGAPPHRLFSVAIMVLTGVMAAYSGWSLARREIY